MLRALASSILILCLMAGPGNADRVTVFAAASLKDALDEIAPGFEAATGTEVAVSLAGSSMLARQIQQGAPADVFLSANTAWMDLLQDDGLIVPDSRIDLLRNGLVLVASGPSDPAVIGPDFDLAARLGNGRLAMALVDAVPAGIYGKAALTTLGLWDDVADRVVQTDNVRSALALVSTGEVPLGIVYATDAGADPSVSVVGTFPEDSHPPIVYPAARIAGSGEAGAAFLDYLRGAAARAVFTRLGFGVVGD